MNTFQLQCLDMAAFTINNSAFYKYRAFVFHTEENVP